MAQNEATIPVEAFAGLDVKEGDTLTVKRREKGSITLTPGDTQKGSPMTGAEFCEQMAALNLKLPEDIDTADDPRLSYLIGKHVN